MAEHTLSYNVVGRAESRDVTELTHKIEELTAAVKLLGRQRVNIKADVDDKKADNALKRLANNTEKASKTVRLTQRSLVSLIGAAAAVAPTVAAATAGFGAFGAVAIPTLVKIVQSQSQVGQGWDALNAQQKTSARILQGVIDQYKALNKEIEPQTTYVFNLALGTTSNLMKTLTPLVYAGAQAVATFVTRVNTELNGEQWRKFFDQMAAQAPGALRQVSDLAFGAANAVRNLLEALAPISGVTLSAATGLAKLVGQVAQANPALVQMAALALLIRAPMISAQNAVAGLAKSLSNFTSVSQVASAAAGGLAKIVLVAFTATALYLWTKATEQAQAFADTIAAEFPHTSDQIDALTAALEKNRAELQSRNLGLLSRYLFGDSRQETANIGELEGRIKDLRAQQKLEAQAAAQQADVSGAVSSALAVAADKAQLMANRLKAVTAALDEAFNPSIQAWNAITQLKKGYDGLIAALQKAHGNFKGNTAASQALRDAFGSQLQAVSQLYQATLQQTGSEDKARAAAQRQIPVLLAMAGKSKGARAQVNALATSLELSTEKSNVTKKAFMRTASQMGINKTRAEKLWKEYSKIPHTVKTVVWNNAGKKDEPYKKLKAYYQLISGIAQNKKIDVTITTHGKGKGGIDTLLNPTPKPRPHTGGYIEQGRLTHFAGGGFSGPVHGPGSPTSDSVPAMLSNGEYVVRARSVKKFGVAFFDALNQMSLGGMVTKPKGYAAGGTVSGPTGGVIMTGLGTGIGKKTPDAVKAAQDIVKRVTKVYDGADKLLHKQGGDIVTGLKAGITMQSPKATQAGKEVATKVRNVYKPAGQWLTPPGKSLVGGLTHGMNQAIPGAQRATQSGVSGVLTRWGKLRNSRSTVSYVVNSVMAPLVRKFNTVAKSFGAHTVAVPAFAGGGFVEPHAFARGGAVNGPGTGKSDSILARLSNGEFVVNAAATRLNRPLLEALNKSNRTPRGDAVPKFAAGGFVGDELFFNPMKWYKEQSGPILAKLGKLTGNAFNNAIAKAPPKVKDAALAKIKKLYELFGVGNVAAGLRFAERESGKPYIWGGVGPRGYDCSGFQSAITRVILGYRNPHVRMFSTASFAGGHGVAGFQVGRRSNYMVGVNPGSHMAGTLYVGGRAFNVESGGTSGGTGVNGRAGGAFTRHWAYRFGLTPRGRVGADHTPGGLEGLFNAKGGFARPGKWSIVGERGPELVQWRDPGRIFSTQQSERLMSYGGRNGGNGAINIYVQSTPLSTPADVGREVVKAVSEYQRSIGGQALPIKVKT